jgi:hypothetical protein
MVDGPVADRDSQDRATLFVRSQASAFNQVAEIWAPKYRQAAFGAFLLKSADANRALDLAYGDVERAFEDCDSATALECAEDLVHTGPTGTNVGDILIGIKRSGRRLRDLAPPRMF